MMSFDFVSPQPISHNCNTWLLIMQDRLMKWVKVAPLRKATNTNITKKLKDIMILRHGCLETVVIDNDRQFKNG
jgi:hypothetical protein